MSKQTAKHALLVVDMLQDYFDAALWPQSQLPQQRAQLSARVNALVYVCRAHGVPIVWVRHAFQPDLSDAFPHMRKANRRYTIAGTPGSEILPELHVEKDDTILVKKRFSAFFRTDLEQQLRRMQVDSLILAGITTSWCVRSTAVDGYQLDFDIFLVQECLAGFTTQDHEASLQAMDGYIATVVRTDDISGMLTR